MDTSILIIACVIATAWVVIPCGLCVAIVLALGESK